MYNMYMCLAALLYMLWSMLLVLLHVLVLSSLPERYVIICSVVTCNMLMDLVLCIVSVVARVAYICLWASAARARLLAMVTGGGKLMKMKMKSG